MFIIDEHPIISVGVRQLLWVAPDLEVVGEASTAHGALDAAIAACPDLILVDVHLSGVRPLDLCRGLRTELPGAQVVVFTAEPEGELLRDCLACGVAGVLLKDIHERDFVKSLQLIRDGGVVVDERVDAAIRSTGEPGPASSLTPRERQVLLLLAQGKSSKAMATDLGIAPNTVRSYCQTVLFKLKATSRLRALAVARQCDLL